MYNELLESHEMLKGSLKKAQLLESLSEGTRAVVSKMIGEGTVEQVVDKFTVIKKALKEEAAQETTTTVNEDFDDEDFDDDIREDVEIRSRINEDLEDDDSDQIVEDNLKKKVFEKTLHEQLALAGLRKVK
jgi:hypothetical protein